MIVGNIKGNKKYTIRHKCLLKSLNNTLLIYVKIPYGQGNYL